MSSVVDFSSVSFRFSDLPLLQQVSFSIKENTFTAVIGPNGSGKSTAMKLLLGLYTPNKGAILRYGEARLFFPGEVGYVPQHPDFDRLFPITAQEVVMMGLLHLLPWHGFAPKSFIEKANAALERVGLTGIENTCFGDLSGGQMQRVLLARAIVANPKLVILDEPFSNVDTQAEKSILDFLISLKDSCTIVMITHDFTNLLQHVDQVLLFHKSVTSLAPSQLCHHYSLGIYHPIEGT